MMRKVLSGIASLAIALIVLELLSRAIFQIVTEYDRARQAQDIWHVFSEDLGWRKKPGFDSRIGSVHRRFDEEGLLAGDSAKFFSPLKKILFLGDSNTFGNDSPADSAYPAIVDSLLPDAVSINLATPGYSSYQGTIVLKEALKRVTPDLIVASFNYNDRRYVLDRRNMDGPEGFARLNEEAARQRLHLMIDKVYIARAVRHLLRTAGLVETPRLLPVRADTLLPRVSPQAYGGNLREMARLAQKAGAPIMFIILRDSEHQTRFLREGLRALQRSQPDSAIELFRTQLRYGTEFGALTRIYLAEAFRMSGDNRSADSVLVIERPVRLLDGGQPIRLDSEYNSVMRTVAAESGAVLVDGAAALDRLPSVYYDFCHFDARGHRMLAGLVADSASVLLQLSGR